MIERLGIFVVYDRDGIIDDYIPYFLNALSSNLSHLIIVCNGKLMDEGRQKLVPFTTDIFVRPNEGYDAGAIKDVLEQWFGWDKVLKYDELLICNDTCYGPMFPLAPCFEEMEKRDVDFWGMTEQGELQHLNFWSRYQVNQAPLPRHIQSYFMNVKKRLLHSVHFREFWERLNVSNAIHETIFNYEIAFSNTFIQLGYSCSSYVDVGKVIGAEALNNYNYSVLDPVDMVVKYNCPLIKRKAFANREDKDIGIMGNEKKNELVKIIEQTTEYNVNLIWDNLLRTCDIGDIRTTLHLDYIFSTHVKNMNESFFKNNTAVVVANITDAKELPSWLDYLKHIPAWISLVVTTASVEIAAAIRTNVNHAVVRMVEDRLHPLDVFLYNCADFITKYEYLCFLHDQVPEDLRESEREGRSFRSLIWENTIASAEYIVNVINELNTNKRLSFLTVQQPYHGSFFSAFGNGWGGRFGYAKKLEEGLGIRLNLSESSPPFATTHAFWCRTSAIRTAFEFQWEKKEIPVEVLGYVMPHICQYNGYFSATMASDRYRAVRSVDLERILSRILERVRNHLPFSSYNEFFNEALLFDRNVLRECTKYKKLYIYGAGEYAGYVSDILRDQKIDYIGFIITDGRQKPASYRSHPVYYLSEIEATKPDVGVILGVDRRNRNEVEPLLSAKGMTNILAFDI
ncbi:rhamnan synthesis F family protein [Cohnella sp. GbtcB17]|uniref:rhamnan synthesis F family protein n=1 Tax=Cohnella sp. GbtcB17 TaxID=2824762 RepID=UPI001C300186|nr:rhamnan synthesis F family protein [Cohnella sp. GbtcB17]